MKYYREVKTREGYILSIDKVVIDYTLSKEAVQKLADNIGKLFVRYAVDVTPYSSLRIGHFHDNLILKLGDGNSFWVGMGLNTSRTHWGRVRMEFNPNKVIWHRAFLDVLDWLNIYSKPMHTTIKRFDLAIDIPAEREDVRLVKDRRTYSEIRKSKADWTEYLGAKSSTVDRVKLYNKTFEAKLPYPLTRLELTLDPATPFDEINWPVVYAVNSRQLKMDELRLTDTERFILSALLDGNGRLTELGRKTREKMELIMSNYVDWVVVSEYDYAQVLHNLRNLLRYPEFDLGLDYIDPDRPSQKTPLWVAEAEKAPITEELICNSPPTE